MKILLDIDGVLVTTPAWRRSALDTDGFLKFNERAASNLAGIIGKTNAAIVLTTTHRVNYSVPEWIQLFKHRGIHAPAISFINDITSLSNMHDRATEIKQWVEKQDDDLPFVVIDDDLSINGLPTYIKEKCVLTKPLIGLDDEATMKVFQVLQVKY